eukprot:836533_1
MGCCLSCDGSYAIRCKSVETFNTMNGDEITILPNCIPAAADSDNPNICMHDANVKLFKEANFENYRMDAIEIYKWFDSRNSGIPQHFLQYEDMVDQYPAKKKKIQITKKQKTKNNLVFD